MGNRRAWPVMLAALALLVVLWGNGTGLWGKGLAIAQSPPPASAPAAPSVPQTAPAPPPPTVAAPPALTLNGSFSDPQNRFEVGILEATTVSTVAGNPLFQRPDGSLAYTVVVMPLGANAPNPLPEAALVQAAEKTFGAGEGFQTTGFQAVGGGLQIGWLGRLSQPPAPPQPMTGSILAKQQGDSVFFLMVAATEAAAAEVEGAIAVLAPTLKVP